MKINQVAAQLYTLREYLKTPSDVAMSMKKVRGIGYQAVQVSGMGPIPESELMQILDGEGLVCCATHEPGDRILNETDAIIERLQKLNCRHTAYPHPSPTVNIDSLEGVLDLARRLDVAGRKFREAGQVLAYHNHALEFRKVEGKSILEWIFEKTDKDIVQGEPDIFWVQRGGDDPLDWCRRLKNRIPLIHLKDYTVRDDKPAFAELGKGTLDLPVIIREAEASGCQWFIVEQDDCYGQDPFECLATSHRYLVQQAEAGS